MEATSLTSSDENLGNFMIDVGDMFEIDPQIENSVINKENLGLPKEYPELDFDIESLGLEFLLDDFDEITGMDVAVSTVVNDQNEMKKAMENEEKLVPEIKPTSNNTRFKKLTEKELNMLEDSRQSKSTKKNTKWGVKTFQAWSMEADGEPTDMNSIAPEKLNNKLRRFYAEAQPEKKANQSSEYHRITFKNVRAAINRHLNDIGRDIDIVRDKAFKPANQLLDGKLKQNVACGLSRPTEHKPIILNEDLTKISTYLHSEDNPVILRFRCWYNLAVHFVSRGIEFHQQLNTRSFNFHTDENTEYVTISHETKQKNHQGGIKNDETSDRRMYATNDDTCPVNSLKLLLQKTDPNAVALFNHCEKSAMENPNAVQYWYNDKPVKAYQFSRFMGDISRNSKCSKIYTAHSLRATSIQGMSDAGVELRHIMLMSGHKNESSVRSYSRDCSITQKRRISETLSSISTGDSQVGIDQKQISTTHARSTAIENQHESLKIQSNVLASSNVMSHGFISNSSFSNCIFQFASPVQK